MFSFFKKEKWAHVAMFTIDNLRYNGTNGKIFIHLYESNKGSRRIENGSTFLTLESRGLDKCVYAHEIYHSKIARWLAGRYDPSIPRYSEIGEEDTANALKGKI